MAMQSWLWNGLETRRNAPSQQTKSTDQVHTNGPSRGRIGPDGVAKRGGQLPAARGTTPVPPEHPDLIRRLIPVLRAESVQNTFAPERNPLDFPLPDAVHRPGQILIEAAFQHRPQHLLD